ncbi:hypothetical protein O6H91_11G087500 [Diphasiastrum complanatum]|uniref:Uncharacterized protein n=1 Tax=Diphasiastrum complanatum TaxID=34168 RepID=A0ACC2CBJ7_DIPCM|nr:hypothetical protein O6H91_Y493400 [Diphasiastrum complanatum]KAJ7539335.1 hypothetical protein O6H91_11G087500 [Diphasiastrum complanatum]
MADSSLAFPIPIPIASKKSCDTEALEKCLKEQQGDMQKCRQHIDAFRSACSSGMSCESKPKPTTSTQRASASQL